jgi:hypothetical protein
MSHQNVLRENTPFLPTKAAVSICLTLMSMANYASIAAASPNQLREKGAMLREGNWLGDVGTYTIPEIFESVKPAAWPVDGWTHLTIKPDRIERESVLLPTKGALQKPAFLKSIVDQIELNGTANNTNALQAVIAAQTADAGNILYVRMPGVTIKPGTSLTYRFKNGTSSLRPKLDFRYELMLGSQPFAFRVQNGLRTQTGTVYGDGAQYTIEYDGKTFEYSLGQFGWDSTIQAIADIDGDGKPDFIISVGGTNSGYEAILLSSHAKPGKNPASASLTSTGC